MSSLDYYVQRPFVAVRVPDDEDNDSDWMVELEGNCLIKNKDGRRTMVPDAEALAGTVLLKVVYDEEHTTLQFGQSSRAGVSVAAEIQLTPSLYSIADDHYTEGQEVWPQRPTDPEESPVPADPSAERVVGGPQSDGDGFAGQGVTL